VINLQNFGAKDGTPQSFEITPQMVFLATDLFLRKVEMSRLIASLVFCFAGIIPLFYLIAFVPSGFFMGLSEVVLVLSEIFIVGFVLWGVVAVRRYMKKKKIAAEIYQRTKSETVEFIFLQDTVTITFCNRDTVPRYFQDWGERPVAISHTHTERFYSNALNSAPASPNVNPNRTLYNSVTLSYSDIKLVQGNAEHGDGGIALILKKKFDSETFFILPCEGLTMYNG
jgi:hypothetical protein